MNLRRSANATMNKTLGRLERLAKSIVPLRKRTLSRNSEAGSTFTRRQTDPAYPSRQNSIR